MSHVYGTTEVVGSSTKSIDDAIKQAVDTAGKTVRHLEWFEVTEQRGHIVDGHVAHFQVSLKLGFRYEPK
ncbi:dodecin [Tepidicaulis sp. LMO-SS28]|uniref:dodecin n=1 Tax=Tepidicaulis sp. LMO-SS28 TaxID=3447455 RepID=UPI003EE17A9C